MSRVTIRGESDDMVHLGGEMSHEGSAWPECFVELSTGDVVRLHRPDGRWKVVHHVATGQVTVTVETDSDYYARDGAERAVCVGPITWARIHSTWPPEARRERLDGGPAGCPVHLKPIYTSAEMEAESSVDARRAEIQTSCSAAQARRILALVAEDAAELAAKHDGGSQATIRAEVSAMVTRALIRVSAEES